MNINGIKYRVKDDATVHAFRFPTPTGLRRNVACHFAEPEGLADMAEAVAFALDATRGPRVAHVALQATDAGGDVWVVERTVEGTRVTRNGHALGDDGEAAFLAALWDGDDVGPAHRAAALFRLGTHEGEWVAEPVASRGRALAVPRDRWETHFQAALATVRGIFPAPESWGAPNFVALARRLEPLAARIREADAAVASLGGDGGALPVTTLDALARLEQETDLGQKIRIAAQPFLDPANSPQVLKDKIQRLDAEIAALHAKVGPHKHLVAVAPDVPWAKVLQVLSKMQAYAMMVEATREALKRLETDVGPVLGGFTETVAGLLERDQDVIRALEDCLTAVANRAQRASERGGEGPAIGKVLDRWLGREEAGGENGGSDAVRDLDETRHAIEGALRHLGALHKSLIEAERAASPDQGLRDYHAKLSQEFLKLKDLWQQTAKHYRLDEEMSLKGIVALVQHAGGILTLEAERQGLAERMGRYRQDLKALEALILEWRQAAQSTKASSLETPALILAEARSILQLTGVKEAQLKKLREDEAAAKARQHVLTYWGQRRAAAEAEWRDAQAEAGWAPRAWDDPAWPVFFAEVARLAVLLAHRTDPAKAVRQEAIFSERVLGHPLALLLWEERAAENRDRLRFLELVEAAPTHGHALVLVADPILADMMAKMGLAVSQPLRKAAARAEGPAAEARGAGAPAAAVRPARNSPGQSQAGRGPDAELQERAKAALRMLTGGKHDLLG